MNLGRLLLGISYTPRPDTQSFLQRLEVQQDDELVVHVAVLDSQESRRFFGVPLARRGIQPVFLRIANRGQQPYRLRLASLDPNYFPPLEAAFLNHFAIGKRLLGFGLLAWFFLPLLFLLPFKIFGVWSANRRMNAYFEDHGFGWGLIRPDTEMAGFVFTSRDEGTKQINVKLLSTTRARDFAFSLAVPGLKVDHGGRRFDDLCHPQEVVDCDEPELHLRLKAQPRCTMNRRGATEGDPLNLVMIGEFDTLLAGLGARWDETETINWRSCVRTARAFFLGSSYRYSPVSAFYLAGRCQDFSLQKARQTINQRLHLRLWITPLRFRGKPVWIGQISRDIGVRFTLKTWNLTTHRIDPDVDDARDYLLNDLIEAGRVAMVGYVAGTEAADRSAPRHNLTGDPYFTDGLRAVAVFSETRTEPKYLNWV